MAINHYVAAEIAAYSYAVVKNKRVGCIDSATLGVIIIGIAVAAAAVL